ncbi:MAG: hypothetical protein S4CHLAM45_11000 [Chlamydiales bacterium]|nr:hypothetical protein [Chlamydiales bacterium]MCH9619592.1 hypothetical protein [Chlamydiales bacterium]MCH9623198.1 hypothetical protein [Chlamydiales bacterium]
MEHHKPMVSRRKRWGGILLSILGLGIGIAISILAWINIK